MKVRPREGLLGRLFGGLSGKVTPDLPTRPCDGRLIWLQAGNSETTRALSQLGARLIDHGEVEGCIIVQPAGVELHPARSCILHLTAGSDGMTTLLMHFRPDAIVLADVKVPHDFAKTAASNEIPLFLINPDSTSISRRRWWPGAGSGEMNLFSRIIVKDQGALRTLRASGVPPEKLELSGPLVETPLVPGCNEAEREVIAAQLSSRPLWLATSVPSSELQDLVVAHRTALSAMHRLLLVVVPADPSDGPGFAEQFSEQGFTVSLRSADDEIGDDTQIYMADTEGEDGLWYWLSPITFLGGTLRGSGSLRNPMEPATLGSAIIHGPVTAMHAEAFRRLVMANATLRLRDAAELGDAVSDLLAPDLAASLSMRAWRAATEGAEIINRLTELLSEALSKGKVG